MRRALLVLVASAVVYALALAWAAWWLPAEGVALHVNAAGEVDRYGSRVEAVSLFAGIGVFLLGLALAVVAMVRWTPSRRLNVPNKEYWSAPERLPALRRMLVADLAVVFSLPLLFLACVVVDIALTTADPAGYPPFLILVPLVLVLVGTGMCIARMFGPRYRPR